MNDALRAPAPELGQRIALPIASAFAHKLKACLQHQQSLGHRCNKVLAGAITRAALSQSRGLTQVMGGLNSVVSCTDYDI
ncbi:hypothetical protein VCH24_64710 [Variovorax boronicumulans]|nr:hypothetical protein VCH24_64710 [Variovorax boronicumulans]